MTKKQKVLLGMSGGVDSSVAAILLQDQGYEVIGITMKLWGTDEEFLRIQEDAKKVCDQLGMRHEILDATDQFQKHVINDFICQYADAKTPNPCIECNRYLKFGAMYEKAKEMGIDYIATGHYAKTIYSEKYQKFVLKKSASHKKDQSYVLYNIPQEILSHVIFPLGRFETKEQIREIALNHGLEVADKPDSQEICFIPDNNYIRFLNEKMTESQRNFMNKVGNIVDTKGRIRGQHEGIIRYTIGQRRGLGIANQNPLYVVSLNKRNNEVIVGEKEDTFSYIAYVENMNLLLVDAVKEKIDCYAKIRYAAKEAKATLYPQEEGKYKVIFEEKQMAITPGQSIVFYIDDIVLGGGKIVKL